MEELHTLEYNPRILKCWTQNWGLTGLCAAPNLRTESSCREMMDLSLVDVKFILKGCILPG